MQGKSLVIAVAASIALGAMARADEMDGYAKAILAEYHVPGMAIAVVRGGKPIIERYYGKANLETDSPVTKGSVFRIASVSKQFSAAAALLLVERGRLRLDDKVSKFFDGLPKEWDAITVRHLLTATSGIRDIAGDPSLRTALQGKAFPDVLKAVAERPLLFPPGEKWAYCNTGFVLLSEVVGKTAGKPYHEFLREQFYLPLEMKETREATYRSLVPHRVCGYKWSPDGWQNVTADDPLAALDTDGAGEMMCPLADLVKWDIAVTAGRVVKLETLGRMQTCAELSNGKPAVFRSPSARVPGEVGYGMGCFVGKHRGHRVVFTPGAGFGFSTSLSRFPDDGVTVIVLCNLSDFALADEVARGVADRVITGLRSEARD